MLCFVSTSDYFILGIGMLCFVSTSDYFILGIGMLCFNLWSLYFRYWNVVFRFNKWLLYFRYWNVVFQPLITIFYVLECCVSTIDYFILGIGMLCFNKRLGFLDGTSDFDFYSNLQEMLTRFHEAFFLPFKSYQYFNTKLYQSFENSCMKIYR
jgi:hypothetical protein